MEIQGESKPSQLLEIYHSAADVSSSHLANVLSAISEFKDAVSLIQTAVGEIDTKKEDAKKEIQGFLDGFGMAGSDEEGKGGINLLALLGLTGGGDEAGSKKGGLLGLLLGLGGEGSEDGENPLEAVFAGYYQKYLHGDGKDLKGMVQISADSLQQIKDAHEQAIYGGSEDKEGAIGIIPATYKATNTIADARVASLKQIDEKSKYVLDNIKNAVRQTVDNLIGHIARMVAGIIGSKDGPTGKY